MTGNKGVIIHDGGGHAHMGMTAKDRKKRVNLNYHEITQTARIKPANDNKGSKQASLKKIILVMGIALVVLALIMLA